ncbi:hypothetical protein K469DRAFT_442757, partial [Zopfia rhizophila CBS 207.26]
RRNKLNSLQSSFEETFGATMERIEGPKGSKINATKILTWIHLAERPLTVDEILDALAVKEEDNDLDRDNRQDRGSFLNCCLGLAKIDTETSTVRLFHSRLREYLAGRRKIFEQTLEYGHNYIAHTCLTYLMFRPLTLDVSLQVRKGSPVNKEQIISRYPLLGYAACQWGHHL